METTPSGNKTATMNDSLTCNLCHDPGTYESARDKRKVRSHLRSYSQQFYCVWRCANCSSLHSKEAVDLDFFYSIYPFRQQTITWATRRVYSNRLRLLKKNGLKKHHSVLDYGCAQGLFVSFLQQCGYVNAAGYDPYVSTHCDPQILTTKYDFVTSQDVVEHVDDPRACLELLASCVKPGGVLVIGTPRADGINLQSAERFSNELHQPYHRHIPSEKALAKLVEGLGFETIYSYRRFYFDTLIPCVNTRWVNEYVFRCGAVAEALVETPNWSVIIRNPALMFYGFAGYFMPGTSHMMLFFRKRI